MLSRFCWVSISGCRGSLSGLKAVGGFFKAFEILIDLTTSISEGLVIDKGSIDREDRSSNIDGQLPIEVRTPVVLRNFGISREL